MNAAISQSLTNRVQQLIDQRQQHAQAIDQIDATLEQITSLLGIKRGRGAGRPAAGAAILVSAAGTRRRRRRRRGQFATTGEQSVLSFIKERGNPTTREINAHWKQEGRGGSADSLLGLLVKHKRLKRKPLGGKLGSEYSLGSASAATAASTGRKRGRRTYGKTAEQLILDFVKQKGNPTTQEVKQLWDREGRNGRAENQLSRLVAARKLKRAAIPDGRGSRYSLA